MHGFPLSNVRWAMTLATIYRTLRRTKPLMITPEHIRESMQQKALLYDRAGDEHYNVISAFIKSMQNQRAPDLKRLVLLEPV
jgi:replication-associated recombination protein RarA